MLWLGKVGIFVATVFFGMSWSPLLQDVLMIFNVVITFMYMNVQSLIYDVEDSREKLDRFFSYNFLFFEDD